MVYIFFKLFFSLFFFVVFLRKALSMFMLKLKNHRKKLKAVHKKMSNFMSNKFGLFRPLNLNCHCKLRMPAVEWPLRMSLKRDLTSKSTRIPDLTIVSWICAHQLIKPYSGTYLDCLIFEKYKFAPFLAITNIFFLGDHWDHGGRICEIKKCKQFLASKNPNLKYIWGI